MKYLDRRYYLHDTYTTHIALTMDTCRARRTFWDETYLKFDPTITRAIDAGKRNSCDNIVIIFKQVTSVRLLLRNTM